MGKKAIDFGMVRTFGLSLPGVEEGTSWGTPALKVKGKMFACIPSHRSAEPDSLAIRLSFEQRDELLAAEPDVYYVKEHYLGYPCVLVRLNRVHPDALRDLLRTGWRFVSESATRKRSRRPPTARR
jgi:hypothetical protein